MKHRQSASAVLLVAGALGLAGFTMAQGWRIPTGNAQAALVSNGGGTTAFAAAALPSGGGMSKADQDAVSVSGVLSTSSATAVTSGDVSNDRFGVQSVATAADVAILGGRIQAARVIAIATVSESGSRTTADGDGSGVSGLVVDGVAYETETFSPNTRVELPGAGYMVLNEQVRAKGRGVGLTVNMIHVYMVDPATGNTTGEVIVASASSSNGT